MNQIKKIICDLLKKDEIHLSCDDNFTELEGWDSMTQLHFFIELEAKYSVNFEPEEMMSVSTLSEVLATLSKKGVNFG